jgi:hypothetical protein
MLNDNTVAAWNNNSLTWLGLDPMTIWLWVQYAVTEVSSVVLYCYGFMLYRESVKNSWFIKLEIKIVYQDIRPFLNNIL